MTNYQTLINETIVHFNGIQVEKEIAAGVFLGRRSYSVDNDGLEVYYYIPGTRVTLFTVQSHNTYPQGSLYCLHFQPLSQVRGSLRTSILTGTNAVLARMFGELYKVIDERSFFRLQIKDSWIFLTRAIRIWSESIPSRSGVGFFHNPRPFRPLIPEPTLPSVELSGRHANASDREEPSLEGVFASRLDKDFANTETDV